MPQIELTDLFEKNLALLKSCDPALARRVEEAPSPENVEVLIARDGSPVPRIQSTLIHSAYRPCEEAARSVSKFEFLQGCQTVVLGLGFGYHVLELLKRRPEALLVIEPLMSVFRSFISHVDITPFLPATKFIIAEPSAKVLAHYQPARWNIFPHQASVRLGRNYYETFEEGVKLAGFLGKNKIKVMVIPPFYGGSLPTARYCAQALKNLGHDVSYVECEEFADSFFALSKVTKNKQNSEILSRLFMQFMGQVIAAKAAEFAPDLVLAMAQAPMTPQTITQLKRLKVPIAFWFVEDFRTMEYWKEVAGHYDHFFTIQKGEFFKELELNGRRNQYYLPQACLPEMHCPLNMPEKFRQEYSCDLSFMGAAYYNRQKSFPRLMDFDFKIWGTEWDINSDIGKLVQNNNERVSTEDTVRIYNGAKINLNLHSSTFHEDVNPLGDFVNPRTFEIASCGGFQLVDEREELHDLFHVGEEIITFSNIGDLRDKISYYLSHDEERKSIADKARTRALKDHTFEKRMSELLIQVFLKDFENLKERVDKRVDKVGSFIEQAGVDTDLASYLERFRGATDFSLIHILKDIENGQGALTKNELLMLMLEQVVKEEA